MVKILSRIGDGYGLVLDRRMLSELAWSDGQPVNVEIGPDGKSLILTLAAATDVEEDRADRKARVREAAARISDRQESVLKRLAK